MLQLKEDFSFCKLHDIGFTADRYGSKFTSYCGAVTIWANTQNVIIDNKKANLDTLRVLKNLLDSDAVINEYENKAPITYFTPNFDINSCKK